ncbi:hypothetical protein G6O69_10580 [Pseudenhygromyxa sp. WMMC2535]|uniref:hypothetical protein n=1 Tax=Pseudenhygromyxa sp. WMMC2535 TaxID=2712867 RepID=UPI001551FECE|nr:hypothetical protein [Pseudenhygromyxa sp. WMMC2535]NVB38277.1 hypothetical protein [Pseudenhygromyxa sp. WMMC2535]
MSVASKTARRLALTLPLLALAPTLACGGEDEVESNGQRGLPPGTARIEAGGSKPTVGSRRSPSTGAGTTAGASEAEAQSDRPDRPRPVVTREDFSGRARDPFHNYAAAQVATEPEPAPVIRKQRDVKLSEYKFDELKLIAIVNAGRGVPPTALFLASSDSKSKSVKQGEYFSDAELLLASVNRDYIEVEVVDPELAPGWNLERGERKVIYLKDR